MGRPNARWYRAAVPLQSDPTTLVLTGLRLTSVAPAEQVATRVGLRVDEVSTILAMLADRGLVVRRTGTLTGWDLTRSGRSEGERRLAVELDDHALRPVVADAYDRFRSLNPALLAACTAWQVREVDGRLVVNDHGDGGHDAAAVDALGAVDDAAQALCAELAGSLERFGGYGRRLAHARARVEAGGGDWFTRLTIDSYHSVWFELHEHLLASLGIDRASEHDERREAS